MIGKAALTGAALLVWATPAFAQSTMRPWRDVVFVNISPAVQSGTKTVAAEFSFPLYEETATVGITRDVKGSSFVDVTIGAAILDNIGAAISFATRSASSDAAVNASIPDPLLFNANRTVTTTVGGMAHRETWVGIQGVYGFGLTEQIDVLLMGGPAVAKVEHDVATGASVTETAGLPAVNVTSERVSKSLIGFMVGADVRYFFTRNIGVGGFVKFAQAKADLTETVNFNVGGGQVGVGVRIRY